MSDCSFHVISYYNLLLRAHTPYMYNPTGLIAVLEISRFIAELPSYSELPLNCLAAPPVSMHLRKL